MSRDEKFEVQYLLSLMVVVLAVMSSNIDKGVKSSIALMFLFISSAHLVTTTTYYSIDKSVDFNLSLVESLKKFSNISLQMTSISFIYLFFHAIFYTLLSNYAVPLCGYKSETIQTVITFALPIIPVMGVTGPVIKKVLPSLSASRDISVSLVPNEAKIYPEFDDNDPVLLEVLNSGDQSYEVDLHVDLPDRVMLKINGEIHAEEFKDELILDSPREAIQLHLRHNYRERRTEQVEIRLKTKEGSWEENITCFIRP